MIDTVDCRARLALGMALAAGTSAAEEAKQFGD